MSSKSMGENGFNRMAGIDGGCKVFVLSYLKTACNVFGISGGGAGGLGAKFSCCRT